ncbi:integrase catalytic domain-containing protein [Trichonephila clavipes]|nr:integrase catalytic domain-containing protein [Trichonephila clavipes]
MVIRSEGAVEYVMVGVSRRPTRAIWRGKKIEPVQELEMEREILDPIIFFVMRNNQFLAKERKCFSEKLQDCDIRILDLLQKEKCTQEDYDKEYSACKLYGDKFITYKIKVKNILAGKAQGADVLRFTDPGTRFKLPNIELPTFDGNPRNWLKFWTQFEKIHEDVSIDDRHKFLYLLQSTAPRSSPREIVKIFPATTANYKKAI